jgi:3-deoxy-D-manno-octulosonic-acid transferase
VPEAPVSAGKLPFAPFAVYNAVLHAALPLLVPALAVASLAGRRVGKTWRGQLGLELPAVPPCTGSFWLQASSVGETLAVRPLIAGLRQTFPATPVLLTGSTPEGQRVARERSGADLFATFPFDLPWVLPHYFETYSPRVCLMVETEIWPNLIQQCHRRRVPLVLLNGRISPARMGRYRLLRPFYAAFLAGFALLLMQTGEDADRIVEMGACPGRVRVAGDLKYDSLPLATATAGGQAPLDGLCAVVAGSTHPGESEQVLEVYRRLRVRFTGLALVLAPRHPETAEAACAHAVRLGLDCERRSLGARARAGAVLVLDTMGELASYYDGAAAAFVGGSLVPVGGHSLLEPASLGRPVLYGPHAFNFRDAASLLERAGGGFPVAGAEELEARLAAFLAAPAAAEEAGRRALEAVNGRRGATARTLDALRELLEGRREELR